ncbi:MAG: FAD-dependent monooxygenase [Janthinobacterium lividum]
MNDSLGLGTLELFQQRGLAEKLVSQGNKVIAVSAYGAGKRVFRLDFEDVDSEFNYELLVSQATTEQVMRDALDKADIVIERELTLISFAQPERTGDVTAVLEHADGLLEKVACAYMIDCEGAHSITRSTLGLEFDGKTLDESYALGDLHIDGDLPETDLNIFSSEHGFMGLFPMGDRRFRLIASNPFSKPEKGTEPALEELQRIYDQRSHIPAHFHDMTWSSWFRINSRMVTEMQRGQIFLGGDSAHIHSPAGGQGMNTGMQDMINLCWKLAMVMKGKAKPELLKTYTPERVAVIKTVLTKTEGLTHAIGSENPIFRSVFNHIAPWIVSTDFVQKNSTERMCQLSLEYRDSSLSSTNGHAGSLKAGDRVPDFAVTVLNREGSADQEPRTASLLELMDPSTFTLFYSNITDPAKTHAAIQGHVGAFHGIMRGHQIAPRDRQDTVFQEKFGPTSSILLVRPDGYIAFTGSEESVPKLAEYCDRWLVAQPLPVNKEESHA